MWTIPGSRTKNGAEHDVPLSEPAQAILASAARIAGSEFVFTTTGVRPISGYSQAKERLDALMLQIAREEATEAGRDASAVTVAPLAHPRPAALCGLGNGPHGLRRPRH